VFFQPLGVLVPFHDFLPKSGLAVFSAFLIPRRGLMLPNPFFVGMRFSAALSAFSYSPFSPFSTSPLFFSPFAFPEILCQRHSREAAF